MNALDILRICTGGIYILFVPGLAWSYFFFARKEIDWIERTALSIGLSLAIVPLSVFWLNWLFHIGVSAVTTLVTVAGLVCLAVFSIYFRTRMRSIFKSGQHSLDRG